MINLLNSSPAKTAKFVSGGKFEIPPHIAKLDDILLDVSVRKFTKLIINMPPRHGKSELISKFLPFWYLGMFPTHRVILASYEAGFASMWGRKVRDLISEFGENCFGISLADGSTAVNSFSLKQGGSMNTTGVGGPMTGRGADLLIIDDPVKNDSEAMSPVMRQNAWDWFVSTAFTRLEPNGVIIIVMTRWHEDDLCGRLLENFRDDWKILSLPAIANEDDPLGRNLGDCLWEKRFSIEKLNEIKNQIGSYWFSALYDQSPSPQTGSIFKREMFRYFEKRENCYYAINNDFVYNENDFKKFACVDLAISASDKSDYTVVLTFAVCFGKILVLDILRERIDGSRHIELIKSLFAKHNYVLIGIESVQYQAVLTRRLAAEGLPVKELRADKDKFTRALPIAAKMEAGDVYFLRDAPWLEDFEKELLSFPNGRYDDQTDAFSYSNEFASFGQMQMPQGVCRIKNLTREF